MASGIQDDADITLKLKAAFGGEWQALGEDSLAKGFSGNFAAYKADAVVGVANQLAHEAGIHTHDGGGAYSTASGVSGNLVKNASAPRDVVIPESMAGNEKFKAALTDDVKARVHAVAAHHLQIQAGRPSFYR